ncbi:uncharacterized protein CcaverHIS019_0300480 [Cutaneotrichosporon cavernicola]|uniref:Uncharacterized protein n=1 Tax=Cutaneotrichosporon cavernicola TaxID=279322 RepID=A0AA48L2Q2_9TREE|nr:uncharacterized protein CcaverHIS019_0300480 [Cutaneotrichosporon cavernicola]BEI89978.1 hypothetical protein CcaverHIS019_0300480 [Cutaneotrichosporon cavernicola]BEI97750.1 hypothetical protein CcaverHIS631_0300490 [Cutaneotrichosporon cavernicola]BEJ05528.1 hypothetical protein CcaverHIS641_0300500 [Cutaneotrichosporon cavernicola]
MVRGSPFWPTMGQDELRHLMLSMEADNDNLPMSTTRSGYMPPGYFRKRALQLRKRNVLPDDVAERYLELERKASQTLSGLMSARHSPCAHTAFLPSPTQVEEDEVANVLSFNATVHQPASSPACEMADEEVILVPRPGNGLEYIQTYIDTRYQMLSSLPSPAASTVSRDITSPAPISQANSPLNDIQFTLADYIVDDYYGNGCDDIEVDTHPSSPHSVYSTPSTAIPSPYNKLNRSGAFPLPRRHDSAVARLPNPQSRVVTHASKPMTWVNGVPLVGTTPPPPSRSTMVHGRSLANAPPPTQSRWSKAPQDLPKDYFGGPGFAPVRPSTFGFNRKQTMTPHPAAPAALAPLPLPQHHHPQPQPTSYWEAPIDSNPSDLHFGYPVARLATPPPLACHSEGHHRVAHLDEQVEWALAYWFTGLIVNRLAYPNASTVNRSRPQMTMGHFDPYHVVSSGHSYSDGHIVVATELVHHMFNVINRIKTAETFVAAVYFLHRLALHDVDGLHGSEFRAHLVPRHPGDVPFALERRVAAIVISLAHNTLEDRDFHLPNNMMWEIGHMERTRFNLLKKHALQDMTWDVNITSEAWRQHIANVGLALYPADPCCSTATVTLLLEHREILSGLFSFMWNAANALCYGPESLYCSPATVAPPLMSRDCSTQGPNYGHCHSHGQSPDPKARAFAYDKHADPYSRAYPESDARWHSSPFDYTAASAYEAHGLANRAQQHSLPSQPACGSSSVRHSRDFEHVLSQPHETYSPIPPSHALPAAADTSPPLEEVYLSRTASQEARARRARDAYMLEQKARARRTAEARELEEQAQRQHTFVFDNEIEAPHVVLAAVGDVSLEQCAAPARSHRREVTKQMRTKELRAKRARALYLQRTYGPKSRNMILA